MQLPLSKFGFTKEDQELLENRLNPDVNRIFLNNIAKINGIEPTDIIELDYSDNDIFKHNQWNKRRELNAKRNLPINKDAGTTEYEYKTFEEAQANDKKSKHILLEDEYPRGNTNMSTQFKIDGVDEKEPFLSKGPTEEEEKSFKEFCAERYPKWFSEKQRKEIEKKA